MASSGVTKIQFCALKTVVLITLRSHRAGLKKLLVCRLPTLGVRVGSVGRDLFFILVKASYQFLIQAFSRERKLLSVTIVVIDIDKVQVNQRNKKIRANYMFLFFISNPGAKGLTLKMV